MSHCLLFNRFGDHSQGLPSPKRLRSQGLPQPLTIERNQPRSKFLAPECSNGARMCQTAQCGACSDTLQPHILETLRMYLPYLSRRPEEKTIHLPKQGSWRQRVLPFFSSRFTGTTVIRPPGRPAPRISGCGAVSPGRGARQRSERRSLP